MIRTQIVRGLQTRFVADMQSLKRFANRNGVHRVPEFKEPVTETPRASLEIEIKGDELSATLGLDENAPAAMPSLPPAYGVYFSGTSTSITFNLPRKTLPPLRDVAEGAFDEFGPAQNLNSDPNANLGSTTRPESPITTLGMDTLPLAQRVRYKFTDPLNAQSTYVDPYSTGVTDSLFGNTQQDEPQITQLTRTAGFIEWYPFLMGLSQQSEGSSNRDDPTYKAMRDLDFDDQSDMPETGEVEDAIPEVIWCRFYYYDGFQWRSDWDSNIEKGLPVAIAMHIVVNEPLEPADLESLDPLGPTGLYGDLQGEMQAANTGGSSSTMVEPFDSLDEVVEADRPDGDYHRIICALSVPDAKAMIRPVMETMPGGFLP
ncbi:MAG: hypothetical protein AAF497_29435 [Planctomycetota bacterium]